MPKKKRKLYLDTSVLGFSLNQHDLDRKIEANFLLQQIREGLFVGGYSFVLETEIKAAPSRLAQRLRRKLSWAGLRRLRTASRSLVHDLATRYCEAMIIPAEYFDDAMHVAAATLWRADALVSYNFAHLVRLDTMVEVNEVNREMRLAEVFICQPSEVIIR